MSKGLISVISQKMLPHCLVEIMLCVSSVLSIRCHEESIDKIRRHVSLPGFRKGKVPRQHILASFQENVDHDWRDSLAKIAIQMALQTLEIKAIPPAQYEWIKISLQEDCEISVHLERHPVIPDWNELEFTSLQRPNKILIEAEEAEKKLYEYSKVLGDWSNIDDEEAIADEDRVSYKILSQEQNLLFEETDRLCSQIQDPAIRNAILACKVGNSTNCEILSETISFPQGTHIVHVLKASRKIPLSMDEAFAKKFNVESMEKLREETINRLQQMSDLDYVEIMKDSLQKFLIETLTFDLPKSLISKEIESRQTAKGICSEEEQKEIGVQSEKALRLFFFVESVAAKNKITLSKEHQDFIWTQNAPGKSGEPGRQRMTAQLIQHESLMHILRQIGWA